MWLKLSACKYLHDDALVPLVAGALRHLRDLDVSYSPLPGPALQALLHKATHLRTLNTSACVELTAKFWSEPTDAASMGASRNEEIDVMANPLSGSLRELTCVGCPQLRSVQIASTTPALSNLQHLNLQLSMVANVDIQLARLVYLNLRGCVGLTRIHLKCSSLQALYLQGCSLLQTACIESSVAGASELELLDLRDLPQVSNLFLANIRSFASSARLTRIFSSCGICESEEETS